ARSSSRSHAVWLENRKAQVTIATASRSHAVVVTRNGCGSGAGAPVGRRCRAVRGADPGGAAGAPVRSVFSLTGHPAFLGRAAQASRSGATPPFLIMRLPPNVG